MKLIKKTVSNIPFDLHDSRIVKTKVNGDNLTLLLDQVYEYQKDSEKFYPANLMFTKIDLEECYALVFDGPQKDGAFTGVRYNFRENTQMLNLKLSQTPTEGISPSWKGIFTKMDMKLCLE